MWKLSPSPCTHTFQHFYYFLNASWKFGSLSMSNTICVSIWIISNQQPFNLTFSWGIRGKLEASRVDGGQQSLLLVKKSVVNKEVYQCKEMFFCHQSLGKCLHTFLHGLLIIQLAVENKLVAMAIQCISSHQSNCLVLCQPAIHSVHFCLNSEW